jgi:ribulose-phosphate 3-epimerase
MEEDITQKRPEYRKIFLGSDHAGYEYVEMLVELLRDRGYDVNNVNKGNYSEDDDYPDVAFRVYQKIQEEGEIKNAETILLCGSGEGMCMVANTFPEWYAAEARDEEEVRIAREHNGNNVLCLGARELSAKEIEGIVLAWLDTNLSQESRHKRRRKKIRHIKYASSIYWQKKNKNFSRLIPAILTQSAYEAKEKLRALVGLADWVQIDFMDGTFTKNSSIRLDEISTFHWPFLFEAHLMVENPLKYIDMCKKMGYNRIIFHHEIEEDSFEVIEKIRSFDMEVGIAINPKTALSVLDPYLSLVDTVLVLGVAPGSSGQIMSEDTVGRIEILRKKAPRSIKIAVDGGVNEETLEQLLSVGVDRVCASSTIFSQEKYSIERRVQHLREKIDRKG